jgi:glycerate dehydrogenase
MLLSLNLRLDEYRRLLVNGALQRSPHFCLLDYPVRELAGRSFGIIGWAAGRAVARVAQAFGMRVLVVSRCGRMRTPGKTLTTRSWAQDFRSCWPVAMCCPCIAR